MGALDSASEADTFVRRARVGRRSRPFQLELPTLRDVRLHAGQKLVAAEDPGGPRTADVLFAAPNKLGYFLRMGKHTRRAYGGRRHGVPARPEHLARPR